MALEMAARIEVVVMDKTGTLTKGEPEVTEVVTESLEEAELLRLVAAVERESEHPLAEAVVHRADEAGVPNARAVGFESVPGQGAMATIDGRRVVVGNRRLMDREGSLSEPSSRSARRWRPADAPPFWWRSTVGRRD